MKTPRPLPLVGQLGNLLGPAHVLTEAAELEPYVTEWRGQWRGACVAAVRPGSAQEVAQVVRLCVDAQVPIFPQGGNTGLVGGGVPAAGGVVLSTARLNKIRTVDAANGTLTADAGVPLARIQAAAAEADRLFPLSLASEGTATLGGVLSTNAGGVHVLRYGTARDLLLGLEVVLADGRIWQGLKGLRKDNTGYDLKSLFLGAEGTLGLITAATVRLFPRPRHQDLALAALKGAEPAQRLYQLFRDRAGPGLTAFEFANRTIFAFSTTNMDGNTDPFSASHGGYALIELTDAPPGTMALLLEQALDADLIDDAVLAESGQDAAKLWKIREDMSEAQSKVGLKQAHDVSVPVAAIPAFIEKAETACLDLLPGVHVVAFGHFGDGNIHFNLVQSPDVSSKAFRAARAEVQARVHAIAVGLGGSFSAEHGIGLMKRDEMAHYRSGAELAMMRALKAELDPLGLMNPGKVLPDP